jgi:hypothetical protein
MATLTLVIEFPEAPENFEPLSVIEYLSPKVKSISKEFQSTVNYEWNY